MEDILQKSTNEIISFISVLSQFIVCQEDIKKQHEFGISHIMNEHFEDGYIRTPLGGFFNHSDNPNCEAYVHHAYIMLRSIKDIKAGEEITVKYWLYDLK